MYEKTVGTRLEVFRGKAEKTSYGKNALFKKDLVKNKRGRIVSKKASRSAKKNNRLVKAGYTTKKGTFGFVKVDTPRSKSKSKSKSKKK
jgi:hypothetical protein